MANDIPTSAATPFAGRYVLGDVLGSGGMSTVYRAHDQILGRTIALKILGSETSDPALMKREQNEIALLASLSHHALVTLYDANVAEVGGADRSYLAMELIDGPTLDARLRTGPIAPADTNRMLLDLTEALHVVHQAGVVHRDIKPGNILLAPTPSPGREFAAKLADFGIAALVDSTRVTATGTVVGTAAYLSPEQALGTRVGPPSDIYSLGLVLLEELTGEREFPGTIIESLTARMNRDPIIPGRLGYDWKSLLTAMTARDPAARPTAEQILARAQSFAITAPSSATAPATATATATALADSSDSPTAVLTTRRTAKAAVLPNPGRPNRRTIALVIAGVIVAIILLLLAVFGIASRFNVADPSSTPKPAATSTPTPPSSAGTTPAPAAVMPKATTVAPAPVVPAATTTPAQVVTAAPAAPAAPVAPTPKNKGAGKGPGGGKGKK